ncbi:MAG: acyl-CoA desaturase [Legionellales bacterium]|nr:acyl-CoA desaturase [Legionellales bacterium]
MNVRRIFEAVVTWFDSSQFDKSKIEANPDGIDWVRVIPYILMHVACLLVLVVGFSWVALWVAVFLYGLRVFTLTAFYHRYFSHRGFKANRFWQFVFALIGTMAVQRGPLWWAAHHRLHHKYSDQPEDVHSPKQYGFWWSHTFWFLANKNFPTHYERVQDWMKFPELVWLDRFDMLPPVLLAITLFSIGQLLAAFAPGLHTNGWQLLVWGFFISTIAVYHVTFCINSLAHVIGRRRYRTTDTSRNNWLLALFAFGEGWHNNHHYYPSAARQGFFWWEFDISYYVLVILSKFKIVSELRQVPAEVRASNRIADEDQSTSEEEPRLQPDTQLE